MTSPDLRAAIEEKLALYAWAFDMDQLDRLEECFTEDAEVWWSRDPTERRVGRVEVLARFEQEREKWRSQRRTPWHVIGNLLVSESDPTEVSATSMFTFIAKSIDGWELELVNIGYYDDRFRCEDGDWRISRRYVCGGQRGGQLFHAEWFTL